MRSNIDPYSLSFHSLRMSKRTTEMRSQCSLPSSSRRNPSRFDPEPSASADVVIKDEFVVTMKTTLGLLLLVPPSTEPTSLDPFRGLLGVQPKFDKQPISSAEEKFLSLWHISVFM
ncbi:hypothetical protein CEXT_306001 [Caerostris extrusa]|uniref:Uncharacterized protein n=1 Tax=Caerostris extrusa TaxID=172846 RepID=A0AAV4N741_CAEEX|nr:hypothetical protein CEXT_306001 [Caerostris extrusa]